MRSAILAVAIILAFPALAFSCPDLSGTYSWQLPTNDSRKSYQFKITQQACDSITLSDWIVTWSDGTVDKTSADEKRVDLVDGQRHENISHAWTTNGIETMSFDVNHEHCNEHGYWTINIEKNSLDYSFRFECPDGNSATFTPETTAGWTGQRYLKLK